MRGEVHATEDRRPPPAGSPAAQAEAGRPATLDGERRALAAIAAKHGRPQVTTKSR